MMRAGPTNVLLTWLQAQEPDRYFSLRELACVVQRCLKRTGETVCRMHANGQLCRIGEFGAYQYRLPAPALETTWKPDTRRPLVASLGVVVRPAMPWRVAA